MSCKNYIERLLKSHGWDTISKLESVLKEGSNMMLDLNNTMTEVQTIECAPSEFPKMELQRINDLNELIQKSIVKLDTSMILCQNISSLPSDCIDQLSKDEDPTEGSNGHVVLEKSSGFSYHTLLA